MNVSKEPPSSDVWCAGITAVRLLHLISELSDVMCMARKNSTAADAWFCTMDSTTMQCALLPSLMHQRRLTVQCLILRLLMHSRCASSDYFQLVASVYNQRLFTCIQIMKGAEDFVARLNAKRSFTDTANFTLRCGTCLVGLKGEKEAVEHAKSTGHANFQEYQ